MRWSRWQLALVDSLLTLHWVKAHAATSGADGFPSTDLEDGLASWSAPSSMWSEEALSEFTPDGHSLDLRDTTDGTPNSGSTNDKGALDDIKSAYDVSEKESELHLDDFFNFKTRPDLQAPKWNVTKHRPADVAPGYWFTAPYETIFQRSPQPSWNGPHIYDSDGELIWSGAHLCERSDAFDFRIQKVHGQKRLVYEYRHDLSAVILDSSYKVLNKVHLAQSLLGYNAHDLNMIDNGEHVLSTFKRPGDATLEESRAVGFKTGKCLVAFDGFRLRNMNTPKWDVMFEWSSKGHIPLNESTKLDAGADKACQHHWDYVHLNSVDKCPGGDYLLSARHSDTIYMISHKDGSILYRFGGVSSDTKGDFVFSRQHHIRCRDQNATHLTMTMMDNARGSRTEKGSHPYSRGLVIAVNLASDAKLKPMQVVAEYPHPDRGFANSRGSLEYLSNGNVFLSWALGSELSEHLADGSVVSQATLRPEFLSSYRAYKYEFVGEPTELPTVYAEQVYDQNLKSRHGKAKPVTRVYVSWNGATEVAEWSFNKTSSAGKHGKRLATVARQGFETMIQYNDTIPTGYVLVEAWDKKGRKIKGGASKVVRIVYPPDWEFKSASGSGIALLGSDSWPSLQDPVLTFIAGVVASLLLRSLFMGMFRGAWKFGKTKAWWRGGHSYQPIGSGQEVESWELQEEHSGSEGYVDNKVPSGAVIL